MADCPRPSALWLVLAIVGALAALVAGGFSFLATSFACFGDTAECADGHSQSEYRGRLFDHEWRPAPVTLVAFSSRLYRDREEQFLTDAQGRFCLRAFEGNTTAFVAVPGRTFVWEHSLRSTAPVDPRFADPAVRDSFRSRDFEVDRSPFVTIAPGPPYLSATGMYEADGLWNPSTDAAEVCHSASATLPWYRFEDRTSSWQYAVLLLAPGLTILLSIVGFARHGTARRGPSAARARRAELTLQIACTAAIATTMLTAVLWGAV